MEYDLSDHKECFRRAFEYLLERKGWGAQTELSIETNISQSHLTGIKKGLKSGSLKALHKIAAGLGTTYPAMLELGRQLQEGHQDLSTPLAAVRKPSADPDGDVILESPELYIHPDSPDRPPAADAHIESLINDVRAILTSGDQAAIEELQRCIAHYRSSDALRRRLVEMEARMQAMEQRLQAADNRIRQSDDPTAKDRILKKREM